MRRANGRDKPWRINFFALGNETWGCGGNMTPAYYTDLYNHFGTFLKTPQDNRPEFIASGGHDDWTFWTDHLIQNVKVSLDGIAHHYYTTPTGVWAKKGPVLGFHEDQWFSTLKRTQRIEGFIQDNIAVMDQYDPEKKVGFFVDEWGTWYDPAEGRNPGFLFQQNSLRDALVASLNFNIFHKYADRVRMANIAQMVNVLQSMILTDKEKMILTPTYHVFKMYIPFQGATTVSVKVADKATGLAGAAARYAFGDESIAKISATAARGEDGKLYLALTNTDPNNAEKVSVSSNSRLRRAEGQLLTHARMDAHNTFEDPDEIHPVAFSATGRGGIISLEIPAKSVLVIALD
jgi:alpha-N-arabinofuranosidase